MATKDQITKISFKLKEYKTDSDLRSDFINGRIKRLNYRVLKNNDALGYEMYSFIKIVVCIESLSPSVCEDIRYRFAEMWLNHKLFFNKKHFECVIFALAWYCTHQDSQPVDVSELVEMFFKYKDQPEMLSQVFKCESKILKYYED